MKKQKFMRVPIKAKAIKLLGYETSAVVFSGNHSQQILHFKVDYA